LIKPTFASRKALIGRKFRIVACFINPLAKVDKPGDESHQRRRRARFWLQKLSAPIMPGTACSRLVEGLEELEAIA
jgi:hypothetical protein